MVALLSVLGASATRRAGESPKVNIMSLPPFERAVIIIKNNIGPGAVQKSTVYKKLRTGDRNIFKSYTSHCRYKGKFHKQLHQRRLTEIAALFVP